MTRDPVCDKDERKNRPLALMRNILRDTTFSQPIENRYFEDYVAGSIHRFGSLRVEEKEIITFAKRFDPQVFHTDPNAAKETVYGGLIASGWHTSALMMRLFVDHYLSHIASLGSPGINRLRWLKPVRPGDEISIRVTVLEAKRSRSKPDRGIVRSFIEAMNQDAEVVMDLEAVNFLACRKRSGGSINDRSSSRGIAIRKAPKTTT